MNLLHMHGGCRYEKWYLLHMNEGVISTSVEHVLGSHSRQYKHGGKSYRLCIWITGHPMVALRNSISSRRGWLASVEEAEPRVVDRICISHPC